MAGPPTPPLTAQDRQAGYRYDLSTPQAEFPLTQASGRPHTGRVSFEEALREHLDLGRPDPVPLSFGRRAPRRAPGRFRPRVLTTGGTPSLPIDSRRARLRQSPKEGRAPRTETATNDPHDCRPGKRLANRPALRPLGSRGNRRLLDVQQASPDGAAGEEAFRRLNEPAAAAGQGARAVGFAAAAVQALLAALRGFRPRPRGFSERGRGARLLGTMPEALTPGPRRYPRRRLRLRGLTERIPKTPRERGTDRGGRTALLCTRT